MVVSKISRYFGVFGRGGMSFVEHDECAAGNDISDYIDTEWGELTHIEQMAC